METGAQPRITTSEILDNGVIVSFDDGTSVFYTAEVLFAIRDQGKSISGPGPDDGNGHADSSGPPVT